jgi:vacuolar-type H+-ATPase subunit I/STV1
MFALRHTLYIVRTKLVRALTPRTENTMTENLDWAQAARDQITALNDRREELADRRSVLDHETNTAEASLAALEAQTAEKEGNARKPADKGYPEPKARQLAAQFLGEHLMELSDLRTKTQEIRERTATERATIERELGDLDLKQPQLKRDEAVGEFRNAFRDYEQALAAANAWRLAERVRNTGKAIGLELNDHPALVHPGHSREIGPYLIQAEASPWYRRAS